MGFLSSLFFTFWRVAEIITLIPTLGMLVCLNLHGHTVTIY